MMMSRIKVLPDAVVNQIAAGEVVERPSSVVRELVDNAVDAGADDISVFLGEGGHAIIRVTDNGNGMSRADALLAFERHATSKLTQLADLQHLSTMGFRGEALASIASVARVSMRTRASDQSVGTEILIAGGVLHSVQEVGCARGTEIEVKNLFFNTPARRKFLKAPRTEELRVVEWIVASALYRPTVRYKVLSDTKELLSIPRAESFLDRAERLFRGTTVRVRFSLDEVAVDGLIAHPAMAKSEGANLVVLVNGRVVTDRAILRAIRDGFSPTLKPSEYPVGCVSVVVPPELVDVNVNPQKSEVRFAHPQKIFLAVRRAIEEAIREFRSPVPVAEVLRREPSVSVGSGPVIRYSQSYTLPLVSAGIGTTPMRESEGVEESFRFSDLRYVGQVFDCYLLCEYGDEFVVVDMHAAHERYNYNLVRQGLRESRLAVQTLLVPMHIELTEMESLRVLGHARLLAQFGFEVEPFGTRGILIRAVPAVLQHGDLAALLREIALLDPEELDAKGAVQFRIDHVAARIACHSSIRSGRSLEREEAYALFRSLDSAECSAACPHGRPIVVTFHRDEVEQWFGRDR